MLAEVNIRRLFFIILNIDWVNIALGMHKMATARYSDVDIWYDLDIKSHTSTTTIRNVECPVITKLQEYAIFPALTDWDATSQYLQHEIRSTWKTSELFQCVEIFLCLLLSDLSSVTDHWRKHFCIRRKHLEALPPPQAHISCNCDDAINSQHYLVQSNRQYINSATLPTGKYFKRNMNVGELQLDIYATCMISPKRLKPLDTPFMLLSSAFLSKGN